MKNRILLLLFVMGTLSACRKNFDSPPLKTVNDGARLSIQQLKNRTTGANNIFRFAAGDTNLYCTVTADEEDGNLYKQIYANDEEGGSIQIRLLNSGGLLRGDHIRINLNGVFVISANSMIYLDSIDLNKSVVKLSSGNKLQPKIMSLAKILTYSNSPKDVLSCQSQLVEINNVEFKFSDRGKPFANAIGKSSLEYGLTDCLGNEIGVRTSGMSSFASKLTPAGNGKIIGVIQQYNSELTLVITNFAEMQMSSKACVTAPPTTITGTSYLNKDFNDNLPLSGGWTAAMVTGTTSWTCSNYSHSSSYARIYNKTSGMYEACESWLISPEINLYDAIEPVLTFESANSSAASPLTLYVTENFESFTPSTAVWKELVFNYPKGNFEFVSSGTILLAGYTSKKIRIAFKYNGTAVSGSIWQLDNIAVFEKE